LAEVIKKLKKNSSEEVWMAVTDYKDRELIDIRVYYRSVDDMQMRPTKRGVSLPLAKSADLLEAMEMITPATPLGETLKKIHKSETEMVYVSFKEFKGHKLVDVRTYFRPHTGEELVPSQKGVAFKFAMLDDVKEGLRRAKELSQPK